LVEGENKGGEVLPQSPYGWRIVRGYMCLSVMLIPGLISQLFLTMSH